MTAALVRTGRITVCCGEHTPAAPFEYACCGPEVRCCPDCPAAATSRLPSIKEQVASQLPTWAAEDIGDALWHHDYAHWAATVIHPDMATIVRVYRQIRELLAREPF